MTICAATVEQHKKAYTCIKSELGDLKNESCRYMCIDDYAIDLQDKVTKHLGLEDVGLPNDLCGMVWKSVYVKFISALAEQLAKMP